MAKQRKRDGVYWRKDRRMYWISFVDKRGLRQRKPGAQSWDEARHVLAETLAGLKEEANLKPGEVLACRDSFADVVCRFLAYQKPRLTLKAYQREEGIAAHLRAFFTGRLADVTSSQVSDYVTSRLGKVSKSSVRKELNTAKHLSPDQFRRLLAASPEKMRPIFALLTATGMRRSELLECQRNCVEGSRILLPTSKNDEPKEVHLNAFAEKVLASIPKGEPEDRLFPDVTPEAVSMAFRRVCKQLGIVNIRLHDLRHTFATWLRQRGTELDVIASQLGHRDLRMTKRYARIASAQVRQAVNGIDSMLAAPQEAETSDVSHPLVTRRPSLPEACSLTH